ncbi:MAG TPA: AAA domain-containing protein [Acidimicrobiales bacterium]|nr:AAA domain-containing protein [Acidimicrobiales bacterium]
MDEATTATASAREVLLALADLTPSAELRSTGLTVPTEWFRWLPLRSVMLFAHGDPDLAGTWQHEAVRMAVVDRQFGERLAAVDQVRPERRSLRVGWLFLAGTVATGEGGTRRVFHPLVTMPVRVERPPAFGDARLAPAGDVEITELVGDGKAREDLEASLEVGGGALDGMAAVAVPAALLRRLPRLQRFARDLASAAGLPTKRVVPADRGPDELARSSGLVVVAGVGVYAVHETGGLGRAGSLRSWAGGPLHEWTAFHSLYLDRGDGPAPAPHDPADDRLESPYPLTPVQREAVVRSRHHPVTLVSGAPGTGKSHAVAAVALDALARGERVLVAAKSQATVDALMDLFERAPGPEPVVFGSSERRQALAARLAGGQLRPAGEATVSAARRRMDDAVFRRDTLWRAMAGQLHAESLLAGAGEEVEHARLVAPALFDTVTDLAEAGTLGERASAGGPGWWARRRRRSARRALDELARSMPDTPLSEVSSALGVAQAWRVAGDLVAEGGLELGRQWERLAALDDEVRSSVARWLAADSRSDERLNRRTLAAVAALATALRSGRAARRSQLRRLDDATLTRALPLWVGTLPDIDDLLPPLPSLFDLAVLDEASSIEQPLAAPALLRSRRAVIVGDPRQLRHVSFLSDDTIGAVVADHGLDRFPLLAARLDVRRNSTFDVAAGAVPVLALDEHFRSDPHLVEFVSRRIYAGEVQVATRSPSTESRDCVHVVRLDGRRDRAKVVREEVAEVVRQLRRLRRAGAASVGVITPFRAQADALEEAVLDAFTADDLEALDLRVGTVHAFQGNERDVVLASLGLGPDDGAASWRFVEDPHLFTVFVTRARRRLVLLLSADPPAGGLMADYLAQADAPAGRPAPVEDVGAWAGAVADGLSSGGVPVTTAYPTGRHVLDVCLEDRSRDVALECRVHLDGSDRHIQRHLALRRAGWTLLEAYRSKWGERPAELTLELLRRLDAAGT